MGLLEKIFKKKERESPQRQAAESYFKTLTAYQPTFTSWRGQIYESLIVRAAIDARARHMSKLRVVLKGSARPALQTRLRRAPNDWQTWSQFLYRTSTILDMQNNAFVVPVFDSDGVQTGIYTVLPSSCDLVNIDNEIWMKYRFSNGDTAAVEFKLCGLLTKFNYSQDFFGDNNAALNQTLALQDLQNQGLAEAVKASASYRFIAQVDNFSLSDDLDKERNRFNSKNFQKEGGGGVLLFPNTYKNIKQIESKPYTVPTEEINAIKTDVFNYFGVNEDILQGKAAGDELDAFFDSSIEPFEIQASEVLTKMLFTQTEQSYGAGIYVVANRLQYMKTSEKIALAQQLGDRGMITINEVRELFNYEPLPEEIGSQLPIRGEYYFAGDEEGRQKAKEAQHEEEE